MMNYTLGIDCGGTFIKAALFDNQGNIQALHRKNVSVISETAGYAERDMQQLWAVCAEVVRLTIEKSSVDPSDIKGVGISAQGKGHFCSIKISNLLGVPFFLPTNVL